VSLDLMFGKTRRDWSCGSIVLPAKQERRIYDKLDDVRYDVRRAGGATKIGLLCLSASIGLLAISEIYRSASGKER
jgi:hypothetical protein